jgi:PadR family transcriptional regulator
VTRTRRPSAQTVAVLAALAADPSAWRHGYDLGQQIGLKAGSLYPILMRLCDRGLLEARWETDPPQGRPARHLYRLTGTGAAVAREVAEAADAGGTVTGVARAAGRRGQLRGAW